MRTETIYHLPERKRDRNGDFTGPAADRVPIPGVVIWPRASEEKDGGEVNIDGQNCRCPDNEAARKIKSDDHVEIRGEIHAIDEPPARYAGKAIMLKTKRVTT